MQKLFKGGNYMRKYGICKHNSTFYPKAITCCIIQFTCRFIICFWSICQFVCNSSICWSKIWQLLEKLQTCKQSLKWFFGNKIYFCNSSTGTVHNFTGPCLNFKPGLKKSFWVSPFLHLNGSVQIAVCQSARHRVMGYIYCRSNGYLNT